MLLEKTAVASLIQSCMSDRLTALPEI